MPIFAFMGASILRQDSHYSFQIITRTIDSIIPPLIKVCEGSMLVKASREVFLAEGGGGGAKMRFLDLPSASRRSKRTWLETPSPLQFFLSSL